MQKNKRIRTVDYGSNMLHICQSQTGSHQPILHKLIWLISSHPSYWSNPDMRSIPPSSATRSKTYLHPNLVSLAARLLVVVLSVEVGCSGLLEKHQWKQAGSLCDSKSREMFSGHFIFVSNSSRTEVSGRGRLAGCRASDVHKHKPDKFYKCVTLHCV